MAKYVSTPRPAKLTREQARHLTDRLRQANWSSDRRRRRGETTLPKPPAVKAAQRVLDAWKRKVERANEKRSDQLAGLMHEAEKQILFGTPEQAQAAVEAFEKAKS